MTLSKTILLGVIVLAFDALGELKIPVPRLVSVAAAVLGVSRKAGYQARDRIRSLLSLEKDSSSEELQRELLTLRIRNQVLTHERDHPRVRFGNRKQHLPAEARSLAVRIFRDFRTQLPEADVATLLGVPLTSLRRWSKAANSLGEIPPKPERRGTHRRATAQDAQRVIDEYKLLEKPLPLEEFTRRFNAKHPEKPLDRKTITRILQRAGLKDIETRNGAEPYRESMKVYFPGAQIALDGTKCDVVFTQDPQETITLNEEVAIDIATGTILGEALGPQECSEGVDRVLMRARSECESILAVLSDNGSANTSETIQRVAGDGTEVGQIFSFPAHPWTNGHVEGLFGQFARIAGRIQIDDSSRAALAHSVLGIIWRIYIHFHNYSPRERLGGLSPLQYLRSYHAAPEEIEKAKAGLSEQKTRSKSHRQPHPRLADQRFMDEVRRIVETHRLDVPVDTAARALVNLDSQAFKSASDAFFAYSKRDGFDERKRTFAYFMGIVRNKQDDLDAAQTRSHLAAVATEDVRAQGDKIRRQIAAEAAEEQQDLLTQPERVILEYAEMLLAGRLRFLRERSLEGLRRGIDALRRAGRATTATLESLNATIQSWGKHGEHLKQEVIKMLKSEFELAQSAATERCPV